MIEQPPAPLPVPETTVAALADGTPIAPASGLRDDAGGSPSPRFGHHANAFGFMRLLLAASVIVSHATSMLDGNEHREVLHRLFGTVTLGELAVDGFFAISGYLIAGSLLTSRSVGRYMLKRIARIYPGFIVATLVSLLIVGPLAGVHLDALNGHEWLKSARVMLFLEQPHWDGSEFVGAPNTSLNPSMWTIGFEFRCYLLLVLLMWTGILRRPWALAALVLALLAFQWVEPAGVLRTINAIPHFTVLLGDPLSTPRLSAIFLSGAFAYVMRDRIRYTGKRAIAAFALLVLCFFVPHATTAAFALFGTYLMLACSFLGAGTILERINNRDDISYGTYLYAWPIMNLLIWYWPAVGILGSVLITTCLALGFGYVSWHLIEKPALAFLTTSRRGRERADAAGPAVSAKL